MRIAAKVRKDKDEHPNLFCYDKRCLWRVIHRGGRVTPCPKHADREALAESAKE